MSADRDPHAKGAFFALLALLGIMAEMTEMTEYILNYQ
jgi:hypothetical protein